jgi:hypothetical protein
MFDQYRWDTKETASGNSKEKPEHKMPSHMADAVRYAIYTFTTGG